MNLKIFHAPTMTLNTSLARRAIMNDVRWAGNKPLPVWLYAVRCGSLQQLLARTPISRALIWPLATWRSGERYESRSPIGTQLDVISIVFGKTLNATCLLLNRTVPEQKYVPLFF